MDEGLEFTEFMLARIGEIEKERVRKKKSIMKPPSSEALPMIIKRPEGR